LGVGVLKTKERNSGLWNEKEVGKKSAITLQQVEAMNGM
jgi:hypothetical protein